MAVSQEVQNFIRASFRSVWALELLCLLRENRNRSLPHAEMVAGLRGSDLVVTQSVESLTAAGLVTIDAEGGAEFRPASEKLNILAGQAAALYGKSPDAVRRMIVAANNSSAAAFADAFRLRKD
jgi:hypothetical protein